MVWLLCVVLVCGDGAGDARGDKGTDAGIVDVGSTGTRLNVYRYKEGRIESVLNYENTPGLSDLNDFELKEKLEDLFKQAASVVDIKNIPIGVYGTAGLRGLGRRKAGHKLLLIRNILKGYNIKECRLLSGKEEGRLAFETLMYFRSKEGGGVPLTVKGTFTEQHDLPNTKPDIALIDMGGRSVQVVYQTNGKESNKSYELGHKVGMKLMDSINCKAFKSLCVYKVAKKLSTLPKLEQKYLKEIYLTSFFYDILSKHLSNDKTTLKDLFRMFSEQCKDFKKGDCKDLFYLIGFLNELGIPMEKELRLVGCSGGLRFNWSIAKAYELTRVYNKGELK